MPCNSDGYPPSERELWVAKAVPAACEMAKILTKEQWKSLSKKTKQWIAIHKKYDREAAKERKRERQEKTLRLEAFSKLSPAEKRALRL